MFTIFLLFWEQSFTYVCSAKTTYLFDFRFLPGAFFVYNEFTLKLFDLWKSSTGIKIFCPIRLSTSLVKLPNPKTDLHTNVHNDAGVYTVDSTMASYDLIQTILTQHKKWSFPLWIYSLNVTRSAGNCGFGHIYCRNL